MQRYLLALVAGMLTMMALLAAILLALSNMGSLPPPQFSNSICVDEKIAFMRKQPPINPDLLVVGSSVAWRHFNSPIAAARGFRPYNAAFCGSPLQQTEEVTAWLTKRLPAVRQVLLIASPLDLEDCGAGNSRFDIAAADRFIFGKSFPGRYYAAYFDPVTFAKNAAAISHLRQEISAFDALLMNDYGDGPTEPRASRGLFYGDVKLDPRCFASLRRTALDLQAKNIPFSVALTPLAGGWKERYDAGGRLTGALKSNIERALSQTGGNFIQPKIALDESAFFDAIHIRWSQTPRFTHAVLDQL